MRVVSTTDRWELHEQRQRRAAILAVIGRRGVWATAALSAMAKKAIVLTFDRLHLGFLGCYGNDWVETPGFDRLALNSIVFDQHFGESFAPGTQRCGWWTGAYQFPRGSLLGERLPTLPEALLLAGTSTRLICETQPDGVLPALSSGAEQSTVNVGTGLPSDETEIPFAALVDEAVGWLQTAAGSSDTSWLLWLNAQGVPTPWTPPRSYAERYLDRYRELTQKTDADDGLSDSEDRKPTQVGADKTAAAPADASSDALTQLLAAGALSSLGPTERAKLSESDWRRLRILYAAYVSSIDCSLTRLLTAIEQSVPDDELLLMVAAAAGEPLGERTAFPPSFDLPNERAPGPPDRRMLEPPFGRLCEEIVHVPLLVRMGGVEMGSRRQELVQTVDLVPTLIEWFGVADCGLAVEGSSLLPIIRGDSRDARAYLCLGDDDRFHAIRTAGYYLIRPAVETSAPMESDNAEVGRLFLKPDDVWDMNDVAAQSPGVAAELATTLHGFVQAARNSLPAEFPSQEREV